MLKKISQQGFALIGVVVILLVLAAVGGAGYFVWSSNNKSQSQSSSQSSEGWKKGGLAVKGEYADANIVKVDGTTWRMYYGTQPQGQNSQLGIFSSTSTDGKTWVQDQGARKTGGAFPEVIKLPDGRWRMYFQEAQTIKSAISADGLTFTDEPGIRVDALATENPAVENAAAPAVMIQEDGTFVMLYRVTISGSGRYSENAPNPTTALSLWATSTDGLTFTKKGIAIDPRNQELDGQIDGMTFVTWDDGKTRIYATSYAGVWMFTFDGSSFGAPTMAFAGEAGGTPGNYSGPPPGDPTLAKINGTWFMYYGGGPEDPGIHYATL